MSSLASRPLRGARAALICVLVLFAHTLVTLSDAPPLGTDSLIYHLSIPAFWLQDGVLAPLDLAFHGHTTEHDPKLTQTLNALLLWVCGDDGLAWLVQPAALLGLLVVFYRSARLLGASRPLATALVPLLLLFPPFFRNTQVINNDLVLTLGWSLVGLGLLLAPRRPERGSLWACGGLALMLATKTISLVYVLAAAPLLVFWAWRLRRRPTVVALGTALLLLGANSYLRNLVTLGNPVFPSELRLGEWVVAPGLYRFGPTRPSPWNAESLVQTLIDDGRPFAPTAPGSLVLWLSLLLIPISARTRSRKLVLAGLPLAATLLYFLLVPFWQEHRLVFPVFYSLWLCFAAGAVALERAGRRRGKTGWAAGACVALVGLRVLQEGFLGQPALALALLASAPFALWWPTRAQAKRLRLGAAALLALTALCGPLWYPSYRARRHDRRPIAYASHYAGLGELWNLIDERSRMRGLTIAYSGSPMTYPLFGRSLQNTVRYVKTWPGDAPHRVELKHGDWFAERMAIERRRGFDDAFWIDQLTRTGVDLLLLHDAKGLGGVEQELAAARANPERFRLVAEGRDTYGNAAYLYAVN